MGNQLTSITPAQIFPIEYYFADLSDSIFDISLGSTRFFKVARAKHREGLIVVKVFPVRDLSLPLKAHREQVDDIRDILRDVPNALPFQRSLITDKAGILIRQYVKDNLYDRLNTRPFLNNIEKRWIAFQLLQCLSQCHEHEIYHGDIKLENIMVTSWNWIQLTDFASFKPTKLDEGNPADYSYFFDTSGRRVCYIAPERFFSLVHELQLTADHSSSASTAAPANSSATPGTAAPAAGSIAQASPSFIIHADEIKTGDLTAAMDIFSLGCALTELFTDGTVPFIYSQFVEFRAGRYDPSKALEKVEDSNLKKLVQSMMQMDPTARLTASEYLELQRDEAFPEYFYTFLNDYMRTFASAPQPSDEKIYRLKKDIGNIIEVIITYEKNLSVNKPSNNKENVVSEGLVIIVSLLTSLLRALKHCSAKLNALEVLQILANYMSPEIILDRLLPYLIFLAKDKYPKVRVAVIQTLTDCLSLIKSIPRSDSNIFPEYILPNLSHIAHDDAVIVRMAYAENIASLAETALRFLEMTHSDMEPDPDSTYSSDDERNRRNKVSYDHELQALQELVQQSVTTLLSDPENAVKQTLLERGIRRLCIFFGRQKGNDVLLSHMITYLNDKEDRHLRRAFFDAIVDVATYVGWQCCPILKPLLQQGLTDSEEFVICKALSALSKLTVQNLLQKQVLSQLLSEAVPLLIHPNLWIRQSAVGFICVVAGAYNCADVQCRLIPLLQPYLKPQMNLIQVDNELVVLHALKESISRSLYDYLIKSPNLRNILECLCERRISRSVARAGHHPSYREVEGTLLTAFNRLQSDGMTEEIEELLLELKDHLLKVQAKKCTEQSIMSSSFDKKDNGDIDLATLVFVPQVHSVSLALSDRNALERSFQAAQGKKSKRKTGAESPILNMNEEWQHMFGTNEQKAPSSPKLQHQGSENSFSRSGKSVEESLEIIMASDGKISPLHLSVIDDLRPNHCAPCREELHALIHKKREEWLSDEIARAASEADGSAEDRHAGTAKKNKIPSGQLIGHLQEHRGAVNRMQIILNTPLFATCSNDGTVKIWDCEKVEGKNIANRSRLSYNRLDGPVSCMAVCHNMQSIAAASETGSIHVFRISYENTKSALLHTRNLDPIEEGCVVDMDYFDNGSQSVLTYATVTGSIVGWDLRSPGTAWKLENDPRQGVITSFCTDIHQCWLTVGTAQGCMVCWDLRFQLPITSISYPGNHRIRHLTVNPKEKSCIFSSIQGNNEVSMWNLETQERKLIILTEKDNPALSGAHRSRHSVYSMCWSAPDSLITAGSDMRVRYWDLKNPANSHIMVRGAYESNSTAVHKYTSKVLEGSSTKVYVEHPPPPEDKDGSATSASHSDEQSRRYPETPPAGHYDVISALCCFKTTQPLLLTASKDGVVKIWK